MTIYFVAIAVAVAVIELDRHRKIPEHEVGTNGDD